MQKWICDYGASMHMAAQLGKWFSVIASYGLSGEQRIGLANLIIERLEALVHFLLTQAQKGNEDFEFNKQDEHHLLYLADIKYIKNHLATIEYGLRNP